MTATPDNLQELTTFEGYVSTENGSALQTDLNEQPPHVLLICIQILIGSVTLIGNILIIRVVCSLPEPKLRKTTKLLICYVSVSFCFLSVVIITRLFKLPCFLFQAGITNGAVNVLSGMLYLAFEAYIIVKKPYTHRQFSNMKICTTEILISCFAAIGITILGYVMKKESDGSSICYLSNGQFHAVGRSIYMCLFIAMIIAGATFQLCTLKALRNITPVSTQSVAYTASSLSPNSNSAQGVAISGNAKRRNVKKSPLHKQACILAASSLCFVTCWMPNIITNLVFSVCDLLEIQVSMKRQISTAFSSLVLVN